MPNNGSFPTAFASWHPQRQAEFGAGRQLTPACVRHLGVQQHPVIKSAQRPYGRQATSVPSHTKAIEFAVLVVQATPTTTAVGLDLEFWFTAKQTKTLAPRIATATERQLQAPWSLIRWFTVL